MSRKRNVKMYRSVIVTFLLVVTTSVHASSVDPVCRHATPVDLNSSLRAYAGQEGEPFLVRLEVPAPGLLSVDVTVPGGAAARPMLAAMNRACGLPPVTGETQVLERSAGHLVVAARGSGTYVFGISSQDPRQPLADVKLSSGFVPGVVSGGGFTKDGENEDEIEIDGSPFADPGDCTPSKDGENEDEIEIDGSPFADPGTCIPTKDGENEDEIEIDGSPLTAPGQTASRSLHAMLGQLCGLGEVDDHGDTFTCATFLSVGQSMSGEIRNGWGDDADIFHFMLGDARGTDLWTVEIETTGGVDTVGGLYDRSGQRLDQAEDGGFRIARTLSPGAYFVRISGRDGAEGLYTLRVSASP